MGLSSNQDAASAERTLLPNWMECPGPETKSHGKSMNFSLFDEGVLDQHQKIGEHSGQTPGSFLLGISGRYGDSLNSLLANL